MFSYELTQRSESARHMAWAQVVGSAAASAKALEKLKDTHASWRDVLASQVTKNRHGVVCSNEAVAKGVGEGRKHSPHFQSASQTVSAAKFVTPRKQKF